MIKSIATGTKYITGEQLKKAMNSRIDKMYESRKQEITKKDLEESYSPEEFKVATKADIHQIFSKK